MSQDPRAQVRDLIAEQVHAVDCGCQNPDVHTPDSLDFYRQVSDEVMGLFPDVWQHHTANGVCYVLRTAPTREDTDG